MKWQTRSVLLGVAEVKLPLRRLPEEEQLKVVQEIYGALTEPPGDKDRRDEQLRRRAVGEVDEFFALQEVVLEEEDKQCVLRCKKDNILQFRLNDVMFADIVGGDVTQVMFITRSESFGRAAVVLKMLSSEDANKLIDKLKLVLQRPAGDGDQARVGDKEEGGEYDTEPKANEKLLTRLKSVLSLGHNKSLERSEEVSSPVKRAESRNSAFYDGSSDGNSEGTDTTSDTCESPLPGKIPEPVQHKPDPKEMIEAEINYIMETEHKYLEMLLSLLEARELLAAKAPPYIKKWLAQLFRQVKPLATMHKTLLESLASANYDIVKFCEGFLDLKKQLYTYVYYIENIPQVDQIIAEYAFELKAIIPSLIDKLRQPRLRLNHYVLMLESLQKKLTADEKVHIQKVVDFCKNYLKEADKSLMLSTIAGCPFQLTECGNIVHKSDLKLIEAPDLAIGMYNVVLLQRKLIINRGNRDHYQFVHSIPVDEMSLKESTRGLYFAIWVNRSEKGYSHVYKFKAKTIILQQNWLKNLKDNIEAMTAPLSRNAGRASFGQTGKKLRRRFSSAKASLPFNSSTVDSESSDDDKESSKKYWTNRRKVARKYSSFSSRDSGNSRRQANSTVSDGDERTINTNHGMAPLTVWNFFQVLENLYKALRDDNSTSGMKQEELDETDSVSVINVSERKYISTLHAQWSRFQDDKMLKPPKEIRSNIRRLHAFHSNIMSPGIKDADRIQEAFIETLTSHGEEYAVLYSEYLINRCTLHDEMFEMDLEDLYTSPINHFITYGHCVIQLRKEEALCPDLIKTAADILHDTITNANNYLLAEGINNVPFALSKCEPILFVGRLKMRCDGRSKQDYQIVLVKDQLIILEIRPPLYKYYCSLRLDSVCLGPSADNYHFQLEYRVTAAVKKVYSFWAARKDLRDSWVEEIRGILAEQATRLRDERKRRLEEAPCFQAGSGENGLLQPLHTVDISKSPHFHKKLQQTDDLLETDL